MQLAPYHGHERVDHSMLWTEGRDLDGGFREVRVLRDTSNTLNALNGHLFDGTVIGIYIFFRAMGQECNLEDGSRGVCAAPSR